jgi:hypothetical protein
MKKKLMILPVLVLIGAMSGCTQRLGNFSILSTKNTEIGKNYVRVTTDKKASGVDSKPIIVIIPMGNPNMQEAADRALEKYGAQILTDVVIYYDWFYIPYIYGEFKYRVEGDAWKRVDDLKSSLESDVKNSEQIFALKEVNGKQEFVPVTADDPVLKNVH